MVKPVYKRELSHSYLVIEGIPKEKTDSYQYRMITGFWMEASMSFIGRLRKMAGK